ncbi:Arc family DNA-binding protein [Pseudomonas putida]|uniref:Arc family DNA-binding protein n=1 Tax=Pseudomonas putida TaxID=303 RepID=A0A7V8J414_PSEPU|nr:Arc family DNA-binding protein [Pseudomonas putida]KAF0253996.1 Arc family DNA-binding protein [Pseudomonas putida]
MKKQEQLTVPRDADKFQLRMPDDMREKFAEIAKRTYTSMNSVLVNGLLSYLDKLEELKILIEGARLLRASLEEKEAALDAERAEVAELKAQLEATLGGSADS